MLDDTLGPAPAATLGPTGFAPTLGRTVQFLRPARPATLTGTGRAVHRGGSIAFLAGELVDDAGRPVATATATARIVRHDFSAPAAPAAGRHHEPRGNGWDVSTAGGMSWLPAGC